MQVQIGDTALFECPNCDGVWVDAETFEQVCNTRDTQAAVLHHGAPEARTVEREVRYRPCARCGTMMNRVNFAKVSGTVVDVCKNHGTFLDRGELQGIVRFIQGGGLERARQRQIEDLKEEQTRLRELEARSGAKSPGGVSYGNRWLDWGSAVGPADFTTIIDLFAED